MSLSFHVSLSRERVGKAQPLDAMIAAFSRSLSALATALVVRVSITALQPRDSLIAFDDSRERHRLLWREGGEREVSTVSRPSLSLSPRHALPKSWNFCFIDTARDLFTSPAR